MTKVTAKGIPDRGNVGDISNLPLGTPLTFVEQLHKARRAGTHVDYRIGTPGGMFSWALPKGLPTEEGQKNLAITQPLHAWSYNDFEGEIGSGYGKGTVKQLRKGDVVLLARTPTSLKFTRSDVRGAPIYNMIKTQGGNWITFIQKDDIPPVIQLYSKERFKSVPIEEVAGIMDREEGSIAVPKVDGAGATATIRPKGVDVYGIRRDKNGNLIRYTDYIDNLRGTESPKELQGKSFRGEVYAERGGLILPPQEISGILNSTLSNAIRKKRRDSIRVRLAALSLIDDGGERYNQEEVQDMVKKLNLPSITSLPTYQKPAVAMSEIEKMRQGTHPFTREGVVIYTHEGRPVKSKLLSEADVVIRDVFEADSKDRRAGGFSYSLPGSEDVVGRVGSGFSHETLKDMLNDPSKYIGRTARVVNYGQFGSGAMRSPSFISLHEG